MTAPKPQLTSHMNSIDLKKLIEQGASVILHRWLDAVRANHEMHSSRDVTDLLLIDSVQQVLQEILSLVEADEDQSENTTITAATSYGRTRAQQRFDAKELVREHQLLREHIFLFLQEQLSQFAELDSPEVLAIYQRVGLGIDKAMRATIEAFVEEHTGELRHLSRTDSLTGLYNHKTFYKRLTEEIKRATRYSSPLSIALIDLDSFKAVNESGGHQFGDHLLVRCAQLLNTTLRETDIVCRYGGDEFSIIFPETDREDATILINRLQAGFAKLGAEEGAPPAFGMSFGLAAFPADQGAAADLVRIADERLHEHKQRNRTNKDDA